MRPAVAISEALLAQRGHLMGWVPVCLACGIGGYFSLRFEPTWFEVGGLMIAATLCALLIRFAPVWCKPLLLGVLLIGTGAGLAKWRTERVAAPVLSFRYYGPIEGRVVGIDRSGSDAVRLTLDQVRLERISPDRVPKRVRVSLHGDMPPVPIRPGQRVMTTGHLSPPSGPAEPGGYDFQRHAWFAGLGAVGYTRNPLLRAAPAMRDGWRLRLFEARMAVSRDVQAGLPGDAGAFAAAIMSGDRSGMGQETLRDLRASNLAHLLAISGLHMGLLTAFVFAALRTGMMLVPASGLRLPTKKIAAGAALFAAAAYLALSGGNVATVRAFIMVGVMLVAIMLGRPALTLRAVAIAAVVVLALRPEELMGPGFQMSFAATTALVAVFGATRRLDQRRIPRWARGAISVVLSSFVAGLATAPIAAAHFNQIAHYGLVANLLSVPLMGVLVMPAAVLAACLAPVGLAWIGLAMMGWGLDWILGVARFVAAQDGALGHVVTPMHAVLPVFAIGMLVLILWQGRARVGGAVIAVVGLFLWAQTERPAVLIAESGNLTGLLTSQGRSLSREKGDGFVAGVWLENDGAPVEQVVAGNRDGIIRQGRTYRITLGDWQILQVSGKTALADLVGCEGADILITNQAIETERGCLVFDPVALRGTGALALDLDAEGGLRIRMARAETGSRPWAQSARERLAALPVTLPRKSGGGPARLARAGDVLGSSVGTD